LIDDKQKKHNKIKWSGAVFLLVAVVTWPLVVNPFELIGHQLGEVDNHFWMFWRAQEMFMGHWPVANFPVGIEIPIMDPVNLPVYSLGALVDPVVGYNLMVFFNFVLAFVGGWYLAVELNVSSRAAVTAGVALAASPFLSGIAAFGITESLPLGWLGVHVGALFAWQSRRSVISLVLAAGSLAALLFSGWYGALIALLVEVLVFCALLVKSNRRGLVGMVLGFLAQGLFASLLIAPRFLQFLTQRDLWSNRWHGGVHPPPAFLPHWRTMSSAGSDLLNLFMPSLEAVPVSKSVYLGVVVISLAFIGGKKARLVLIFALPFFVLSLGYWFAVGGRTVWFGVPVSLPALWLTRVVPSLEGVGHWYRLIGPTVLFLGVAAAVGVERLSVRWPRMIWIAPTLILADSLFFSQTPWPRGQVEGGIPAIYEEMPDGGAVVQLPFHNGRREFSPDVPRIYNRWQPMHGHEVAENYEGKDASLESNEFLAYANYLCGVLSPSTMRRAARLSVVSEPVDITNDLLWLGRNGFEWIVVHSRGDRFKWDAWMCGSSEGSAADQNARAQLLYDYLVETIGEPVALVGGDMLFTIPEL
jgi:hypothetical protein